MSLFGGVSFRKKNIQINRNTYCNQYKLLIVLLLCTGGATWAETWTLYDRQPNIYDSPCSDGIVYSPKTDALYFGHPNGINGTRTNCAQPPNRAYPSSL